MLALCSKIQLFENSSAVLAQPFYTFRQLSTKRTSGKLTVGQNFEIQTTSEGNFDENNDPVNI